MTSSICSGDKLAVLCSNKTNIDKGAMESTGQLDIWKLLREYYPSIPLLKTIDEQRFIWKKVLDVEMNSIT